MSLRRLLVAGVVLAAPGSAYAQVARVFVSVNGNDVNICSNIATPCRTLGGGVSQVDPHGEVIVIDSGSYAGATITKSVKIDVAAGAVAFSGLPITVNPGAGNVVVLRGLTLKAATVGSGTGIAHQSGSLFVENTVVDGWSTGLISTGAPERLFIKGSVFRNQSGDAMLTGATSTTIEGSFFEGNSGTGVYAYAVVRISNSVLSNNDVAGIVSAGGDVTVQRCEINGSGFGAHVQGAGILRVSGSTVVKNTTGLSNLGSTLKSFGNNAVDGNSTNVTGTLTTIATQ